MNAGVITATAAETDLFLVTPGEAFGAPGYLRVSYANSLSNLKEAVTRLQRLLEGN